MINHSGRKQLPCISRDTFATPSLLPTRTTSKSERRAILISRPLAFAIFDAFQHNTFIRGHIMLRNVRIREFKQSSYRFLIGKHHVISSAMLRQATNIHVQMFLFSTVASHYTRNHARGTS
jgi:hypothetical protein